jgi:hypothetical protein
MTKYRLTNGLYNFNYIYDEELDKYLHLEDDIRRHLNVCI